VRWVVEMSLGLVTVTMAVFVTVLRFVIFVSFVVMV
jgi:hypothetical protein